MAAPPFLHIRLLHRLTTGNLTHFSRALCSSASYGSTRSEEEVLSSVSDLWKVKEPPKFFERIDDLNRLSWKEKEKEILRDIEPISLLIKDILHSDRYMDGERLTPEDEKAVIEGLLAHHPCFEDKIGCGLDSIMVDRHPQFQFTRCLFVVRMDGGCVDFSYMKCLREYVRKKYPPHAERFAREKLGVSFSHGKRRFRLWSKGSLVAT